MRAPDRVCVIGLGHVGLPTAVALAGAGVAVSGMDIEPTVVARIGRGESPLAEPELGPMVRAAVAAGRLTAGAAATPADAYIIAVPTPAKDGGQADLSHVRSAVDTVAPYLASGAIVILESTVPPGTTRRVSEWLQESRGDLVLPHRSEDGRAPDVYVAHCPERVLPGRIMAEIAANDRIVGGLTRHCAERAAGVYRLFCRGDIVTTDAASAEMAKLVENASRDVNIAFANEMALICERLGVDVRHVIRLANRHPRVTVLSPGPGVGGHCVAVDPWFLVEAAPDLARITRLAREINDARPAQVAERVIAAAAGVPAPRIALLGLAFKADVGDLRGSPAVEIARRVAAALPDAAIDAVEPHVDALPRHLAALGNVRLAGHAAGAKTEDITDAITEAIAAADVVALLVDHDRFRPIDRRRLAGKIVIDTRGLWSPEPQASRTQPRRARS